MLQSVIEKSYKCGTTSFSTSTDKVEEFWQDIHSHCNAHDISFILLFFSRDGFLSQDIIQKMGDLCKDIPYAACTTAGEITPNGLTDGQMMAVIFERHAFQIQPIMIDHITAAPIDEIVSKVNQAKTAFVEKTIGDEDQNAFALCLIDGLSYAEEGITAAFHWGLDDIPLLGGSTGDDMEFSDTSLILNGVEKKNCAILLLVQTRNQFRLFKSDNFIPTDDKLVVTRSDPDQRIIYEFNAAPAAEEYAKSIGMDPKSLSPHSFASHPLVIRVGGEYYCRSIQKMNADGSLTFFCAVDDGIVLRIAKPTGMIDSTNRVLKTIDDQLGGIDMVLGFDCVLRKIDARNRQVTRKISDVYRDNNLVGFNTYGEQYRSMHLNQTLTGVAFSARKTDTKING